MSTKNHDTLADKAERGELTVKKGTVRRGPESRAAAQRLLMEATETSTVDEAVHVAVGRPSLGTAGGQSPIVRARVPQKLKDSVQTLAAREHRAESDIVREALAAYIDMHAVS